MIDGTFTERSTDSHVGLREKFLDVGAVLPALQRPVFRARGTRWVERGATDMVTELAQVGTVAIQLDEPLSTSAFRSFGDLLGTAMPERDPAVQPYVEDDVVLNLRSEHQRTADVNLQPFSANSLSLHSEGSGRPLTEQPRYIVLMCCDPGVDSTSAQTVLIPMRSVAGRLDQADLEVLLRTRYRRSSQCPTIARWIDDRICFSFRDFVGDRLEWFFDGPAAQAERVSGAIGRLLAAMYAHEDAAAVHWRPGMLVVLDNTFFFHGRTAAVTAGATHQRHLKRLRILQCIGATSR